MSLKETPLFKENTKEELVREVLRLTGINYDQEEELKIAAAANNTTNKALHEEKTEVRRLSKVLDRAITSVDCRVSTIRYVPPIMIAQQGCSPEAIEEPPKSEEEKFLGFLIFGVLHDQYKPEKKDQFDRGLGY